MSKHDMSKHEQNVSLLMEKIEDADAICVGAASGLSAAGGHTFYYQRDKLFVEIFGAYEKKYGYHNSFDGFYYRYQSAEERWGFLAQSLHFIFHEKPLQPYKDLMALLRGKNFFVVTTNQDTQFSKVLPEEQYSAIQGDFRFFQCSRRCHDEVYPAMEIVEKLHANIDSDLSVPTELIPRCPRCGTLMEPWVRGFTFLEGSRYREAYAKWMDFLEKNKEKKLLFLELGVGRMTPMFIQEPFWALTHQLPQAFYLTINPKDAMVPKLLYSKGAAIHEDIAAVFADAVERKGKRV